MHNTLRRHSGQESHRRKVIQFARHERRHILAVWVPVVCVLVSRIHVSDVFSLAVRRCAVGSLGRGTVHSQWPVLRHSICVRCPRRSPSVRPLRQGARTKSRLSAVLHAGPDSSGALCIGVMRGFDLTTPFSSTGFAARMLKYFAFRPLLSTALCQPTKRTHPSDRETACVVVVVVVCQGF